MTLHSVWEATLQTTLIPEHSLALRYFRRVIRLFIGFAIALTLVLIAESVWQQGKELQSELRVYERSFEGSLASALWALDWEKLNSVTDGIIQLPAIKGLRISFANPTHEVLQMGTVPDEQADDWYWRAHRFELVHDQGFGREVIGTVEFYSSFDHLLQRSKQQILLILALGLLKTLALGWISYAVGRRLISRPLNEMTESIAASGIPGPLQLSAIARADIRGTELDVLARAYDELAIRARATQQELAQANETLEQRVRQRTAELEQANGQLERMSHTDALTGLANRRHIHRAAQNLIALSRRNGQPLALIVCDIDTFKHVNDEHGHEIGDRAICHVADCLRSAVREIDVVARFGGDEFVLLLPGVTSAEAQIVANRLRDLVAAANILDTDGQHLCLTLSCGIAEWQSQETRFEDLFQRADACLYRAKNNGRDQVICH